MTFRPRNLKEFDKIHWNSKTWVLRKTDETGSRIEGKIAFTSIQLQSIWLLEENYTSSVEIELRCKELCSYGESYSLGGLILPQCNCPF